MRKRKPPLDVIEGGRGWKVERIDDTGGDDIEALREIRELIERELEQERKRATRAEERAEEALAAERLAREALARLLAEREVRRTWGLGWRVRWTLGRKHDNGR